MNRKDIKEEEKERFRSVLEEGKQDRENTKKTSFRLSTKQGLFIFYSILTSPLSSQR